MVEIRASSRFLKLYRKASPSLQNLTEGAVHDFINRCRANPKTVMHQYDRVAHIVEPVLEIDLSGSHRLLAKFENNVLLMLDMGGHEVVGRYSKNKLIQDKRTWTYAPDHFYPERKSEFFVRFPDRTFPFKYQQEISADWLYFLESKQEEICDNIFEEAFESLEISNAPTKIHLILGGPGTGKTCILLNLLKGFVDLASPSVGIVMSDHLSEYIQTSTNANITKYRVDSPSKRNRLDVVLVDDPQYLSRTLPVVRRSFAKIAVLAFDPLQLRKTITDEELDQIEQENDVKVWRLDKCYRQKENVGKTTKHVIDIVAASTPFLDEYKVKDFREERERMTALSNNLDFLNPHGYVEHYSDATIEDVQNEVNRILNLDFLLWRHWPGLLILSDQYMLLETVSELDVLKPLWQKKYIRKLLIGQVEQIKGLEFQHVLIFIEQSLYNELQKGFQGTGQREYRNRRLLRIPFSRAKDSLVTFAVREPHSFGKSAHR